MRRLCLYIAFWAGIAAAGLSPAAAGTGQGTLSGKAIYETRCLLCHPNSPHSQDGPLYKARPDAVPLWTLYSEQEGWQKSQIGLGRWSDERIRQWLRYPKRMKPDTPMIEVPLTKAKRRAVIRYIKQLGRKYNSR